MGTQHFSMISKLNKLDSFFHVRFRNEANKRCNLWLPNKVSVFLREEPSHKQGQMGFPIHPQLATNSWSQDTPWSAHPAIENLPVAEWRSWSWATPPPWHFPRGEFPSTQSPQFLGSLVASVASTEPNGSAVRRRATQRRWPWATRQRGRPVTAGQPPLPTPWAQGWCPKGATCVLPLRWALDKSGPGLKWGVLRTGVKMPGNHFPARHWYWRMARRNLARIPGPCTASSGATRHATCDCERRAKHPKVNNGLGSLDHKHSHSTAKPCKQCWRQPPSATRSKLQKQLRRMSWQEHTGKW